MKNEFTKQPFHYQASFKQHRSATLPASGCLIWRFRGCHPHSPKGKKPNNWLQKSWWYIRLSQSVF